MKRLAVVLPVYALTAVLVALIPLAAWVGYFDRNNYRFDMCMYSPTLTAKYNSDGGRPQKVYMCVK